MTLLRLVFIGFLVLFFSSSIGAQNSSQLEVGDSYDRYRTLETTLSSTLPDLKAACENLLKDLKDGTIESSLDSVKTQREALENLEAKLKQDESFNIIEDSLERIQGALGRAENALEKKKIAMAKLALQKTVLYTKILLESPVLKMTQTQIDLQEASIRIRNKDYNASAAYINSALGRIGGMQIEGDPALQQQMNQIKSDLALLHQQTILGQAQEEEAAHSIWKRMQDAQWNSMGNYYNLWSQTYHPWDQ